MRIDPDKCMGCMECADFCPMECILARDGGAYIDEDECVECGVCARAGVCPNEAIYMPEEATRWPRVIRAQYSDPGVQHPPGRLQRLNLEFQEWRHFDIRPGQAIQVEVEARLESLVELGATVVLFTDVDCRVFHSLEQDAHASSGSPHDGTTKVDPLSHVCLESADVRPCRFPGAWSQTGVHLL